MTIIDKLFSSLFLFLLTLLVLLGGEEKEARADLSSQKSLLTPNMEQKIRHGLDYLASQQDNVSGSFSKNYKLASTALAGLAFLSYPGSGYKRGPYGENIALALQYILSLVKDSRGSIKTVRGGQGVWIHDTVEQGRMHAHGYATLFLAEVYGTLRSKKMEKEVQTVLKGAIHLLLNSQTSGYSSHKGKRIPWGGWGYYYRGENPKWKEDEASVTITSLQAMRAARNAGISVPASHVKKAINYVKLCMKKDGSFRYSLARSVQRSSYELTAAAVSTLNAAGVYKSYELNRGLLFMRKSIEETEGHPFDACQNWPYYGNFYAAQAMYQAGDTYWKPWFTKVSRTLLEKQNSNGSWTNKRFGNPYATSMALLILQVPYKTLPIFQR